MGALRQNLKYSLLVTAIVLGVALASGCSPALIGLRSGNLLSSSSLYGLSYNSSAIAVPMGTAIPTLTPTLSSGSAATWSVSPTLPAGISINSSGVISGTPTAVSSDAGTATFTTHTVTATSSSGQTATFTFKLLVMASGVVVNSTVWANDASANNGVCETCSIKAAIDTVNGTGVGTRMLVLVNAGTYVLNSQLQPSVTNGLTDLVICGTDRDTTILDGNNLTRIIGLYTSTAPAKLTLCNITLRNARLTGFATGGAIEFDQSISGGVVNLNNVVITGTTTSTTTTGGGALWMGHSPAVSMTLNIDRSIIANNVAGEAGGIEYYGGVAATITDSTFYSNTATTAGGGAFVMNNAALPSSATITGSTFYLNSSNFSGGAIRLQNNNTLTITNSVFSQNTSANSGGAIYVPNSTTTGDIRFSTFYGNSGTGGATGGAISMSGGAVSINLLGNIFQDNTSSGSAPSHCESTAGLVNILGYNVYSSAGGYCGASLGGTEVSTVNPGLVTTRALNGGPVLNHALESNSPALDIIPTATCTAITAVDIRNYSRPNGTLCDAGSYEF